MEQVVVDQKHDWYVLEDGRLFPCAGATVAYDALQVHFDNGLCDGEVFDYIREYGSGLSLQGKPFQYFLLRDGGSEVIVDFIAGDAYHTNHGLLERLALYYDVDVKAIA